MAYCPKEAELSYGELFKRRGAEAAVKSACISAIYLLFLYFMSGYEPETFSIMYLYFSLLIFETWKPKAVRFFIKMLR